MKKIIVGVLPLLVVFTLALGAGGYPAQGEEARVKIELTPEELVERVIEAWQDVVSYQSDTEMTMNTTTVVPGETIDMQMRMLMDSTVDVVNQRMMTTVTTEMTMPTMPGVTEKVMVTEAASYWVDGTMYTEMALPDIPGMPCLPDIPGMPPLPDIPAWTKMGMPWLCQLELSVELLKASEIEILRVEEVNGVETYLIKVTPDIKLWGTMMEGMMMPDLGLDPAVMDINLEEMIQRVSMKRWIARETFLPLKDQTEMTMVFEGGETEISTVALYHSFNEAVTIELPPEAAEAVDIKEMMEMLEEKMMEMRKPCEP